MSSKGFLYCLKHYSYKPITGTVALYVREKLGSFSGSLQATIGDFLSSSSCMAVLAKTTLLFSFPGVKQERRSTDISLNQQMLCKWKITIPTISKDLIKYTIYSIPPSAPQHNHSWKTKSETKGNTPFLAKRWHHTHSFQQAIANHSTPLSDGIPSVAYNQDV